MKSTVSESDFIRAFQIANRPENFSREGLGLLFDHFEECEDDTGEEIELDVIAICCEYSEDTLEDIVARYQVDVSECADEAEIGEVVLKYLNDNTYVVGGTPHSIMYVDF